METINNRFNTIKPKNKNGFRGFLILIFIIFFTIGAVFLLINNYYSNRVNNPLSESEEIIDFTIEEGSTTQDVIDNLIKEGILKQSDNYIVKVYLKLNKLDSTIQAGQFSIPRNLNMKELFQTLQKGQVETVWVTLIEGQRMDEFAGSLETAFSSLSTSEFIKEDFLSLVTDVDFINTLNLPFETNTLEGVLFPDKYLFTATSTEEDIIQTLVDNFKNKAGEITYEELILASLLEREGRGEEEKKVIADILNRRLEEGWFLNIDATLLYYHKDWKYELTVDDLKADHEYNTYVKLGLPPTPICNPGLVSINAVKSPTKNNYYYYIHDKDGVIHYAVTYDQHIQNVNEYLQ